MTAVLVGTVVVFTSAHILVEKPRRAGIRPEQALQFLRDGSDGRARPGARAILHLLLQRTVANPLGFIYGTIIILVLNTVTVHFYTVCHHHGT